MTGKLSHGPPTRGGILSIALLRSSFVQRYLAAGRIPTRVLARRTALGPLARSAHDSIAETSPKPAAMPLLGRAIMDEETTAGTETIVRARAR
jgi:hypothetical protein